MLLSVNRLNTSEMRKIGMGRGAVTAYPRQLESLIRLAEAHARMRLSNVVEELDVNEATRLHKEAIKQSATDPKTGIPQLTPTCSHNPPRSLNCVKVHLIRRLSKN